MASRLDGWVNTLTGLGDAARDKMMSYVFTRSNRIDDETLEALYDEDDMASRICDAVPEAMMRGGFTVKVEGQPDLSKKIDEYLKPLEAVTAVTDAMVWENVFGGGAVVIGADDGRDVSQPLDENSITSIRFLNVLDRRDVQPVYWYSDPNSPKYGRPEVYRVFYLHQGIQRPGKERVQRKSYVEVHESRMILFRGGRTTVRNRFRYNGWGTPKLAKMREPLKIFHANWQSVSHMMSDASQGVYKIKNFLALISSGKYEDLITRFKMIDMARSVARAVIVDANEESFERKDTTMSGLPDLVDRTGSRLAAGARMPVTILMGTSPAGLNATGASDIRGHYDQTAAEREQKLMPQIEYLVRLVFLAQDGPTHGMLPDKWSVEFPSLWQETEQEKAQTTLTIAQMLLALTQAQIITPEEGAQIIAERIPYIDAASREETIQKYMEMLKTGEGDINPQGRQRASEG